MAVILGLAIGRDLWNAHAPQLDLWSLKDFTLPQTKTFTAAYIVTLIATCLALASVITAIHQVIIHRLTLALFRLYVAGVSLAVGIIFFTPLSLIAASKMPNTDFQTATMILTAIAALASAIGVAFFCFTRSSQFRGKYPSNFALVSREEFESAL